MIIIGMNGGQSMYLMSDFTKLYRNCLFVRNAPIAMIVIFIDVLI